jgi:hypothetical protein
MECGSTCYVCLDEGGEFCEKVCECCSPLHLVCQKGMVKNGLHSCGICKKRFTNVKEVSYTDWKLFFKKCSSTTILLPPCLLFTFIISITREEFMSTIQVLFLSTPIFLTMVISIYNSVNAFYEARRIEYGFENS